MKAELMDQIRQDEGLRLFPYRCSAGKLTIGFGRNLEDRGITRAEAEAMLEGDVQRVENALKSRLGATYRGLDKARQEVLIQMGFQMGVQGVLAFKKMIQALRAQDYQKASEEMLDSKWAEQTTRRARRLARQMMKGE